VIAGALKGAFATVVMTGAYVVQPHRPLPPQLIARRLGIEPAWPALHLAIGVSLGIIHELSPVKRVPFALGVWAASYATTLPLLRLYPRVDDDPPTRAASGVAAHAVFGALL
jgi:hypothetical protein